ncbi:hypothetical protein ACR34G_01055 [Mycoplasma sp. 480]|uniref:hypothetical protein n=1 Tax=Mycoplasma sp. 480 TaxID=3440155 RepID=UPI003F517D07
MKKNLKNIFLSLGTATAALSGFAFVVSCGETKKPTENEPTTQSDVADDLFVTEAEKTFKTETTDFAKYDFKFDKTKSTSTGFEYVLDLVDTTASDTTPVKHGDKQFTLELKELTADGKVKTDGKTFTATSTADGNHYKFSFTYGSDVTSKDHFGSLGISSLKYDTNTTIVLKNK